MNMEKDRLLSCKKYGIFPIVEDFMKLAIVIPAYNEEKAIGAVLKSLPKKIKGIDEIVSIVVDDGSSDGTYEEAKKYSKYVVKHWINQGLGAAITTGLEASKKIKAGMAVTLDADGQHNPKDIERLIKPLLEGKADMAIGTRMKETGNMPFMKIVGNWGMNAITWLVFHKWSSDTQSGMRAFSKKALLKMNLHSVGYEISSEIIGEARRAKLRLAEVQIETIYSDYSNAKGQDMLNAFNILTKIIAIRLGRQK